MLNFNLSGLTQGLVFASLLTKGVQSAGETLSVVDSTENRYILLAND